jgi:hypothetical protein
MKKPISLRFSYENRVSEDVVIYSDLDLSNNRNRKKLLNRLLKSNPSISEVSFSFQSVLIATPNHA